MKLLNQSLTYLSVSILLIIGLWAVIFYVNTLNEIKDSVDEGLENYKRRIIQKARAEALLTNGNSFDDNFYTIREISNVRSLLMKDSYIDTLMYMQDADDSEPEPEPVRMLTTAFESRGHFYKLQIFNSMVEEDDLIEELLWDVIWLYGMLVVSIVVINNVVLKRLWNPFYGLLSQLKSYRLGSSEQLPAVKTTTREFNDMQQAVGTLLQHSIETYERQKQFIGNASHELQTPLAIATGKLELLLEKGNLDESQAESLTELVAIIDRLVRLNKSLLLLAKIENKQIFDNQTIAVNDVVRQTIGDLEEFAAFKNVKVDVEVKSHVVIEMDRSLAAIIFSNLIRNAIIHNVERGLIMIEISDASVRLCNTGRQAPLNPAKIFTRFYKSDVDPSGTGLGLAIVKAICDLYGFSVRYQHRDTMHCFEIRFQ